MEIQYSKEFFSSFILSLQDHCRNHLNYKQFIEVSGYISVEIDNLKKERYVLSELLQNSGNVISESFCANNKIGNALISKQTSDGSWSCDKQETIPNQISIKKENQANSFSSCSQMSQVCAGFDSSQGAYPAPQPSLSHYQNFQGGSAPQPYQSFSQSSTPHSSTPHSSPRGSCYNFGYMSPESFTNAQPRPEVPAVEAYPQFPPQADEVNVAIPQTLNDIADTIPDVEDVIDLDLFEDDSESQSFEVDSRQTAPPLAPTGPMEMSYGKTSKLSPGTITVIKHSVKQFRKFHFDKSGIDVNLLSTPPESLNSMVLDYFKEAKRSDGQELTPRTLKNVQNHLDMYLRDNGYPFSLTKDRVFQSSREYLKSRLIENLKNPVSAQEHKHSPISDADVECLFQSNLLGCHSIEALTNSMWFLNSKYFAIRRPAEHCKFKWGSLVLSRDEHGTEYLERPINGAFSLKVFARNDNPSLCFVNCYKRYRNLRPKNMLDPSCPFYLKYERNIGMTTLSPEPMVYSFFTCIWRKLLIGSRLPLNKKIM